MSTKKEAYLFLSAMLRSREPRLLSREKCERMLDAAGFEEAAKLLTECGYPDMSEMNVQEIEKALGQHRFEVLAELDRITPDKEIPAVFKMKYDCHNLKALIKAEAAGVDAADTLSDAGRFSPKAITDIYTEGAFRELPPVLAEAAAEAKAVLARTGNPQLSDFVLDKAYFAEMEQAAAKVGNKFFSDYTALLTDSANLRAAVRTLRMGKGEEFMRLALARGGKTDIAVLTSGDKDAIAAAFAHTPLERAAVLGMSAVEGGTLTAFERECDNAVTAFLKNARLIAYGPETVVAYIAAVENELTAIRMILTGRLSGIAPDVIKERLRELYA